MCVAECTPMECMYKCVNVCMYECACVWLCLWVYMSVYKCGNMWVHVILCACTWLHAHVSVSIHMYIRGHVSECVLMYEYAFRVAPQSGEWAGGGWVRAWGEEAPETTTFLCIGPWCPQLPAALVLTAVARFQWCALCRVEFYIVQSTLLKYILCLYESLMGST